MADARNGATGFVCPRCGGALWQSDASAGLHFECRIGDGFSAAELWIDHCAHRNRKLKEAVRVLVENAALARALAERLRKRGIGPAETLLEQEAVEDERLAEQVIRLLEGLPDPSPLPPEPREAQ
jgi:hypothetical protein